MVVQKFGGTSVGSPERMREVASIIDDGEVKIVVLSAVTGTTNKLVAIAGLLSTGDYTQAKTAIETLEQEYILFVKELLPDTTFQTLGNTVLQEQFSIIDELAAASTFGTAEEKIVLAQGELLSTRLFTLYLESIGKQSFLLPALDFVRTNVYEEPDMPYIRQQLELILQQSPTVPYYITQGYICRNLNGEIDNLQRGGSDYTATIVGAALKATEIQIWTDIDGMHNNDPRVVKGTSPVRQVSYREAAELAYFGAKILHPTCVIPAEKEGVPIRLKNTFIPNAPGTLISSQSSGKGIAAIAAKDNITAIKIQSGRMINAYGFLRRVFEVFEEFKTPIDMITTSEVSISLTIDNTKRVDDLVAALRPFGQVSYETDQTIICIVGDKLGEHIGEASRIFHALDEVPLRMVSFGGSDNNVSVLVDSRYKVLALQALQSSLFVESVPAY